MDPLRKERSICRICHQKWIVQFQRFVVVFLFLLIHYIFWLIISLDFVTVAQSWVLAATSGKLYGIFTCNLQLSGMVNSTWLLEIKSFLIQCRTVSTWTSVNFSSLKWEEVTSNIKCSILQQFTLYVTYWLTTIVY